VFEIRAVPVLEDFADALEVLFDVSINLDMRRLGRTSRAKPSSWTTPELRSKIFTS
jgi:hypothetical protein